MSKKIKLDKFEQEIENNLENFTQVQDEAELKQAMVKVAQKHLHSKKPITIRVSTYDIEAIKIKASKMGIPYQSYINMLIHKDATSI